MDHCSDWGGDLVHIFDESQQKAVTKYLKDKVDNWSKEKDYKGSWIGLTDLDSDEKDPYMYWHHGSRPAYENWALGEPMYGQSQFDGQGAACGVINPGEEAGDGKWSAENCVTRKNSICQKLVGNSCPKGERQKFA